MSNELILDKIESMRPYFSRAESKVANYILENDNSFTYSLAELAEKCNVSQPTVIRFARTLGLDGFSDLKLMLSINKTVNNKEKIEHSAIDLHKNDKACDIFKSISEYTIKSIRSTLYNALDEETFESIIDLIYKTNTSGKRIFLTGMGVSSIIAESLQIKLMRIGIDAIFYSDIHLRLEACTNLQEDDLLICFTTLGKSKENHDLIALAKAKRSKTILITQYGASKLEEEVDLVLHTSSIENNLRLAAQASFIIQNLIVETIFLALALKDYDRLYQSIQESKNIFYEYGYYKK